MNYVRLYAALMLTVAGTAQAVTSEQLFPDKLDGMEMKGQYVRKGTIGASLKNVMALDKLLAENGSVAEIESLLTDQQPLGRGLYLLDVFTMQPVDVWLRDPVRQGRILVAVVSLQQAPELRSSEILSRLKELAPEVHPIVAREIRRIIG